MAKFKPYKIESSQLENLSVSEGQFIVTTDTQKVYLDEDGTNRIELSPSPTKTSQLINDSNFMSGMTILKYGSSTWQDFITAYTNKHVVYCRASSNANPASGSQTRMAFMAYVSDETNPTNVEFQYYRSVSSHSDSQQGDQTYVYKLTNANGGTWSVTVRENYTKVVAGTALSSTWASGKITLNHATSGVTAGTYKSVTVDAQGHVTAGSNPTTISGYGITDAKIDSGVITLGSNTITPLTSSSTLDATQLSGAIPSSVTATTQTQGDNSTKIATTAYVDTAIDNLPEPMIFKGSLGTGGTITSLPVDGTANVGDTYKVITDGTYASKAAKVGDTFICLTKTSNANTWELIPSGDEPSGTVTSITINATSPISIDSSSAITTSGSRTISHATSGITAGTYRSVTVNDTGHITAGTNPTTLSGYGITDAKINNGVITLGSNSITPLTSEVNSNLLNGSTTGSLRAIGTDEESASYTMGEYAFAEGYSTKAAGKYSHAEGRSTIASNEYAHAEGRSTNASGKYGHAEGYYTTASDYASHAEGSGTTASGQKSHAEGEYTVAASDYQHVQGRYNIVDSNSTFLDIVGNGTAENARSNAYALDWSGNGFYAGNVYVNGGAYKVLDSGRVSAPLSNANQTYYLTGVQSTSSSDDTQLYNTRMSSTFTGVKYQTSTSASGGTLYVDDKPVPTGFYYDIS